MSELSKCAAKYLVRVALTTCMIVCFCSALIELVSQRAQAAEEPSRCVSVSTADSGDVFNQALSTVRLLIKGSLRAEKNGRWRPRGDFRGSFFGQSGRALREIRTQIEQSKSAPGADLSVENLLQSFRRIFDVNFPSGLRHLRRLQPREERKFIAVVSEVSGRSTGCAGPV